MNYFNDYAIDTLAARVVAAYLKSPDVPRERVDPVALCKNVLKLTVKNVKLSPDCSILGITSFGQAKANVIDDDGISAVVPLDGHTVLIEKELLGNPCGEGCYNFTVAHEAAHHIFNMLEQHKKGESNRLLIHRVSGSISVDFDEWQTERLAAAILMNRDMLLSAMRAAGIPDGIKTLDCRLRNESWLSFCETAETLGVSLSALSLRMSALGLIDSNHYRGGKKKESIIDVC